MHDTGMNGESADTDDEEPLARLFSGANFPEQRKTLNALTTSPISIAFPTALFGHYRYVARTSLSSSLLHTALLLMGVLCLRPWACVGARIDPSALCGNCYKCE